jgi:hypothetical protein
MASQDRDPVVSGPDLSWRPLYRAGAIAAGAAVVLYLAALVLFVATEVAPTEGGAALLDYIDAHRTMYVVKQTLWLVPSLFMMVLVLALTVALWRLGRSLALIAGVIGVTSWAGTFAWPTTGEGSLVLLMLSDTYAGAPEGDRPALVGAAETLIAFNDSPAPLGVMQALGVLLIALLMLRGVFPRGAEWLGVATGVIGIGCEALRPWLGGVYAIYGVLLFFWLLWVAWALWRLAAEHEGNTVDVVA